MMNKNYQSHWQIAGLSIAFVFISGCEWTIARPTQHSTQNKSAWSLMRQNPVGLVVTMDWERVRRRFLELGASEALSSTQFIFSKSQNSRSANEYGAIADSFPSNSQRGYGACDPSGQYYGANWDSARLRRNGDLKSTAKWTD